MMNRGRKDLRGSDRFYFSIKHYFLYFCEMENDKNIQLRDFFVIYDRSVFLLHNSHEIQIIITVSMCLLRKAKE